MSENKLNQAVSRPPRGHHCSEPSPFIQFLKLIYCGCVFRWTVTKKRPHSWHQRLNSAKTSRFARSRLLRFIQPASKVRETRRCVCVCVCGSGEVKVCACVGLCWGPAVVDILLRGKCLDFSEDFFPSDLSCLFSLILLQNNIAHTTPDGHPHKDLSPWHWTQNVYMHHCANSPDLILPHEHIVNMSTCRTLQHPCTHKRLLT